MDRPISISPKVGIEAVDSAASDDLYRLLRRFVAEVLPDEDPAATEAAYRRFSASANADSLVSFVLRIDGVEQGCAQLFCIDHPPMLDCPEYREAELLNFYVTPELRGRGYGTLLLGRLEDEARRRSIRRIRLNGSPGAERLYRRCGYQEPPFIALQKRVPPVTSP